MGFKVKQLLYFKANLESQDPKTYKPTSLQAYLYMSGSSGKGIKVPSVEVLLVVLQKKKRALALHLVSP